MKKLKFISLFAGIGGFDEGFEAAGMECIGQVEIDKHAQNVLRAHRPDVKFVKDIRNVTAESFRKPDLICGGFPCQDLSVAGKRKGLDGERSGLWFEFHRIICLYEPSWVVIENVPGLLSSGKGRDFAIVLGGLTSPRIREICKKIKVSASVMTEALIAAEAIIRVKRGQYKIGRINPDSPEDQHRLVRIANFIYGENAELERKRVARKTGQPVAEPRRKAELEPIVDREGVNEARIARLEKIVTVLMDKAGIPAGAIKTQLKLAGS